MDKAKTLILFADGRVNTLPIPRTDAGLDYLLVAVRAEHYGAYGCLLASSGDIAVQQFNRPTLGTVSWLSFLRATLKQKSLKERLYLERLRKRRLQNGLVMLSKLGGPGHVKR